MRAPGRLAERPNPACCASWAGGWASRRLEKSPASATAEDVTGRRYVDPVSTSSFEAVRGRLAPEALRLFTDMVDLHLASTGDRVFILARTFGASVLIFSGSGRRGEVENVDEGALADLGRYELLHPTASAKGHAQLPGRRRGHRLPPLADGPPRRGGRPARQRTTPPRRRRRLRTNPLGGRPVPPRSDGVAVAGRHHHTGRVRDRAIISERPSWT
jgi:hypothetical protein